MKGPNLPGGEPTAETHTVDPMTGAATRLFPATTASVGQARRFLVGQLPAAVARGEDADALVLMLSELATNAVRHAATEFEVAVRVAPDCSRVRVEVSDGAVELPHSTGASPGRAARARPAHRARAGRRLGHRDAARPTGQDGVVLAALVGARRCRPRRRTRGARREAEEASADETAGGPMPAPEPVAASNEPAWPVQGVRVVLEGLRDAVVATDDAGTIRYVNKAAEDLLGWPRGALVGRPVFDLVPDSLTAAVGEDYGAFVRSQASNLVGRPLDVDIKRADGTDVRTELVISIFDHPIAGPVVVGIIRPATRRSCSAGPS